ncbi:LOW QUALITY PROTEIN: S-adenosylmethionine/tRNA-ribosyltransferase-isomerase [Ruminiclostridium papyrosolvens DSM 2782]|uniref:S-adenosylmethionine:tRNA ribosyltransferase-isomerase n=1 Tax=Ruminiclostridium papyrosolvens DSM 2782 TaxID=588581 RepID=F1THA6_9FIRM|nr:tRNA preQ1(34) S-adenosylmethionine ribosyltransferase-isomerase QueA [Ruminiclostridium papyrosolvens]EGD46109.1 LOW QUALITY PROTEIN: S-adenosylmethionine/tRNA-ribosyltransferase-isomerase [Ruminiclostridium papyrosolvens DSM 2782]WES35894.1 tRNA preQ1(34) S-adenosylmethionine ribosyltransferase-isomerase QueA [Ruminiclostridium papyrosolvens DSM 2782]
MDLHDFDYYLPEELIAQHPMEKRDMSRLMVLNKETGEIEHKLFTDIVNYLDEGDCLVLNNTRVIPARLLGEKEGTGGKIEFVLLKRVEGDKWEVILRPGKKAKPGSRFVFGNGELKAEILEVLDEGNRLVRFIYDGVFEEILDRVGIMPLPPYITEKLENPERYQTVYAKVNGSAAAPTAGLHFTKELLDSLTRKGVKIAYVMLHVGLGTFRPVKVDDITQHKMHSEYYSISQETCDIINDTRQKGKKVVAVGTTSCRVLETVGKSGRIAPCDGWTDIFIYPGYRFKVVDRLITNFHLPESTLIMLVSSLAGRDNVMHAYNVAVEEKYRFFSFGDAMFIK